MVDTTQPIVMTQSGYDQLVAELEEIKLVKIPAAVARLSLARSYGDLSENAEYHAAKEDLAFLEGRRDELEMLVQRAEIVASNGKKGVVAMGTQVVVEIEGKDKTHTYDIVGEWEADPAEKKISEKSPLGQALVGKKVGDAVEVEIPAGKVIYHIREVK